MLPGAAGRKERLPPVRLGPNTAGHTRVFGGPYHPFHPHALPSASLPSSVSLLILNPLEWTKTQLCYETDTSASTLQTHCCNFKAAA